MTSESEDPTGSRSIRATARWAGALNVLSGVPDGFSVNVLQKVVVKGDAAATAANVLRAETLFRLAVVADVLALVIFVGAAVMLYTTLRPAGRRGSLFFLLLMAMGSAFQSLACIQDFTALALLKGVAGVAAPADAKTLAFVFLRMHWYDYQLALLFFGIASLTVGFLLRRATFVPRIFGPLMWLDGSGYVVFVLTAFLAPHFVTRIYPWLPFGTTIGEAAFFFWLIFRSVDVPRWKEQAAATAKEAWA
jgi:hypothetical protein